MMAGRILYNTEAPEEATFPYATVSLVSDVPGFTFEENTEDCLVQFNLHSSTTTCAEINTTFELVKAAFDKYDLVIAGATTISLERGNANLFKVEGVWQLNVVYEIEFQV